MAALNGAEPEVVNHANAHRQISKQTTNCARPGHKRLAQLHLSCLKTMMQINISTTFVRHAAYKTLRVVNYPHSSNVTLIIVATDDHTVTRQDFIY